MRPCARLWRFAALALVVCAFTAGFVGPADALLPPFNGAIAFVHVEGSLPGIVRMGADGSGQTPLIGPVSNFPAWSPYGGRIAYVGLDASSVSQVFVANEDGSAPTQVTTAASTMPAWSPDGQKLAFAQDTDSKSAIFTANADGSGLTPLTASDPGNDTRPAWSPRGTRIAFVRGVGDQAEIYVMSATGADQTPLTSNAALEDRPSWSPDETTIAFTSARNGNDDVYVMNADGSGQRPLTTGPADEFDPAWSPDGTKIVFASTQSGTSSIWVMNADGSGQRPLTSGVDNAPVWQNGLIPGGGIPCVVPKVTGQKLAAAKLAVRRHHCRVGRIGKAFSRRVKRGRVISQRPRASLRRPGTKVNLVVSRGRRR